MSVSSGVIRLQNAVSTQHPKSRTQHQYSAINTVDIHGTAGCSRIDDHMLASRGCDEPVVAGRPFDR